jgi:hypothetical protein
MENGFITFCMKCNVNLRFTHLNMSRCKNCGMASYYENYENSQCQNCKSLELRGDEILEDGRCSYCLEYSFQRKVNNGICPGCKIEPLTCNIKPAKRD